MAGSDHPVRGDISRIRQLLMGVNDVFFVAKELMQNADDAGSRPATAFGLALSEGLPHANHELLRGPALLAVNNGDFRPEDSKRIRSLNYGTKGTDAGKIGKFGLGMKTVFYLSEAFFYLAPSGTDGTDWYNPWDGDLEPEAAKLSWDRTPFDEEDQRAMRSLLRSTFEGDALAEGFCLWIPLRKKHHAQRNGQNEAISNWFIEQSPAFLQDIAERLSFELAGCLPLFQHLERVRIETPHLRQHWRLHGNGKRVTRVFDRDRVERFSGELRDHTQGSLKFVGVEAHLAKLREEHTKDDHWPVVEDGKPEKGFGHGAVVFLERELPTRGAGQLDIDWAVYLPVGVGHSADSSVPLDGNWNSAVTLRLHGYWFIEADRRRLYPYTFEDGRSSEDRVRRRWNHAVLHEVTLPQVLPALELFLIGRERDFSATLTTALVKSQFYRTFRDAICQRQSWVYRLESPTDSNLGRWQLVGSDAPIYVVPATAAHDLPFTVFPTLREIVQLEVVTLGDAPRLTRKGGERHPWTPALTARLLATVQWREAVRSAARFDYLFGFFESVAKDAGAGSQTVIQSAVQSALRAEKPSVIAKLEGKKFTDLLGLLHGQSWLGLPKLSAPLLETLLSLELSTALIPAELAPETAARDAPNETKLSVRDAIHIVNALGERTPEALLAKVLEVCVDPPALRRALNGMRCIPAQRLGNDAFMSVTLAELQLESILLIRGGSRDLSDHLARALEHPPLVINAELAKQLELTTKQVSVGVCSEILQTKPALRSGVHVGLLEELLKQRDTTPDDARAIRYLMHPFELTDAAELFKPLNLHEVWKIVARRVDPTLESRLIAPEYAAVLNPKAEVWLNVSQLRSLTVEQALGQYPERLNGEHLTAHQREQLIGEVSNPNVLKQLAIFQSIDGRFVNLIGNVFLLGGYTPTPAEQWRTLECEAEIVYVQTTKTLSANTHLVAKLTSEDVIALVLKADQPQQFMEIAFSACSQPKTKLDQLSARGNRDIAWLRAKSGSAITLRQVVYLPGFSDEVARILAHSSEFFAPQSLEVEPPSTLNEKFSCDEDALADLASVMKTIEQYQVGNLAMLGDNAWDNWLAAFRLVAPDVMPSSVIFEKLPGGQRDWFWKELRSSLSDTRLVTVLEALAQGSGKHQAALMNTHLEYLREAHKSLHWDTAILPRIKLKNQAGAWVSPAALWGGTAGVQPQFLLDERQHSMIVKDAATVFEQPRTRSKEEEFDLKQLEQRSVAGRAALKTYFQPSWAGRVPQECISAFLASLGDDFEKLAKEHARSIEKFKNHLKQGCEYRSGYTWATRGGFDHQREEYFGYLRRSIRFIVDIRQDNRVEVVNLLGELFEAVLADDEGVPLLELRKITTTADFTFVKLQIPQVGVGQSQEAHQKILRQWSEKILGALYIKPSNVAAAWDGLVSSEQTDLLVTQKVLLKSAGFYFKQLGDIPKGSELFDTLRRLDTASYEDAESDGDARSRAVLLDLQHLLCGDPQASTPPDAESQLLVFSAVVERIKQAQYQLESIPFELFQNADDAYEQLRIHGGTLEQRPRVVLQRTASKAELLFAHWGRLINQDRINGEPSAPSRQYQLDLQKMLTLNASSKSTGDTGKFGLGFKSVYLAASEPVVISGNMSFKVTAGFYPVKLSGQQYTQLHNRLEAFGGESRLGTIIKLPLDQPAATFERITERFAQLALPLLAFAKRVKRIDLEEKSMVWHEESLAEIDNVGALVAAQADQSVFLLLRSSSGVDLLIAVSPDGFVALPSHMPTFWVTAPTLEHSGVGVAVNADFEVDVGRVRLAVNSPKNTSLIQQAAGQIAGLLTALYHLPWSTLSEKLRLEEGMTPNALWESLFINVLSESAGAWRDTTLLQPLLETSSGFRGLLERTPTVPTGLGGSFAKMVKLSDITLKTDAELTKVFESVAEWDSVKHVSKAGCLVSHEVYGTLNTLGCAPAAETITLATLLEIELRSVVSPQTAERLTLVFNAATVDSYSREPKARATIDLLARAQFLAADDSHREVGELICRSSDDPLLLNIAPLSSLLHPEYVGSALEFVGLCSHQNRVSSQLIVQWIQNAETAEQRTGAIAYLLRGPQIWEVARHLRDSLEQTWLAQIKFLPEFLSLDSHDQTRVLATLNLLPALTSAFEPPASELPNVDLSDVERWWQNNKTAALAQFEQSHYPHGQPLEITSTRQYDPVDRRAWLELMMLSAFQTMGRQDPEQHQGFLEFCEERGYMATFLDSSDAGKWRLDLLDFLERGGQYHKYYHWFRQHPAIFQMSHWLPDYVNALLSMERFSQPFALEDILDPRNAEIFQGTSISAPSLERALGNVGRHFLVRELVRRRIISSLWAFEYAYVPSSNVKRFFVERFGCSNLDQIRASSGDASIIYNFALESFDGDATRASFGGAFDLAIHSYERAQPWFTPTDENFDNELDSGVYA